jgi:hypothetical protein
MVMLTDYEIAKQAGIRPIKDIAAKLGCTLSSRMYRRRVFPHIYAKVWQEVPKTSE